MTAPLESRLEMFFRHRVRLLGGYTVKLAPTEKGIPDRLVFFPGGRMYLVELKTAGGRVSPAQRTWHQKVRDRYGVKVHVLSGQQEIVDWVRDVVDSLGP